MSNSPSLLRAFLASRGGAAPWRDWMEAALYDPDNGYYTKNIRTVGRTGDFSTSATLSGLFSSAVRRWIQEQWKLAGGKLPFIEVGSGDGSLHHSIWHALGWMECRGLHSHLVERSPVLRTSQQEKLRAFRRRITWHESMESALTECGGRALIFSNELADAFPATLLQWHEGRWQEVWLSLADGGGIVEELRPCPAGVTSSACDIPWDEGQRIEVLHSWREWLTTWVPHWKQGTMLTIDYGGRPADIYFRRPGGTVRGYLHHQRLTAAELYPLMGRCDVTVDVNFTDLRQWGEAAGLTTVECVSQREFVSQRSGDKNDRSSQEATAPEAFQCLVQRA